MNKTGFGFLRIPQKEDKSIDYERLNPIVDRYLALGGKCFDTAYTYLDGLSEEAIRKAVVERYSRESFILCDKLPGYKFENYAGCRNCFEEQLERCGVDYFDIYLLHGLNAENYELAEKHGEFNLLQELKKEGKAKKIGFSYHDTPELLDKILNRHPEVDVVLLQINYLDWQSHSIRAEACYDMAMKHGKKVMVMEPVKGGTLAALPKEAEKILLNVRPEKSTASWAIRFATQLENVETVLSGMNSIEQVEDNLCCMEPLSEEEKEALNRCTDIIRANTAVACTGCRYCLPRCSNDLPIPEYFALYNEYKRSPEEGWKIQPTYDALSIKASLCISCRNCETACPQHLSIAHYMQAVAKTFERHEI